MKADTMNIELPSQAGTVLAILKAILNDSGEHQTEAVKRALSAYGEACFEAGRSRAASEPGEVARLAEEARRNADAARHDLLMAIYERHDVAATFFAFDRLAVGKDRDAARNALCEYDRALLMKIDNLMALSALAATATSPASEAQAGWVMVPREPTYEMIAATANGRTTVGDIYRDMLAAAPQPASSPAELPGMWEESDLSGGATDCQPASSPVAAEGQKAVAESVVCARCGHENWIMEGKAPCQITESDKRATPTASMADAAEAVAKIEDGALVWSRLPKNADALLYTHPSPAPDRGLRIAEKGDDRG